MRLEWQAPRQPNVVMRFVKGMGTGGDFSNEDRLRIKNGAYQARFKSGTTGGQLEKSFPGHLQTSTKHGYEVSVKGKTLIMMPYSNRLIRHSHSPISPDGTFKQTKD